MAFNIQSLATKVKGSLLGVTFYELNGQQIVRFNSKSCKNPKTFFQQENRKSMIEIIKLYRQVKPVLYQSLNSRPSNRLVYTQFISSNLNKSVTNGLIFPELLKFSAEDFNYTDFDLSILDPLTGEILIEWNNYTNSSLLSSDKLIIVTYEPLSKSIQFSLTNSIRSDGFAEFTYKNSYQALSIYVYLFFVRSDFSASSISRFYNFIFPAAIQYVNVNYGYLYNYFAITDSRFCPTGWHVPTSSELDSISTFLGGQYASGAHLKEVGLTHWNDPNLGALDTYDFGLVGSGYRNQTGVFNNIKVRGYISCSNINYAGANYVFYALNNVISFIRGGLPFRSGLPVRFIKNDGIDPGYMLDYNGNYYRTVVINGVVITAQNYVGTLFSDLSEIPYVTLNADWYATNNPARCAYQNNLNYV